MENKSVEQMNPSLELQAFVMYHRVSVNGQKNATHSTGRDSFVASTVFGMEARYFGALVGSGCLSLIGLVVLLRELVFRERPLRKNVILRCSLLLIPMPLYVIIGYINVPIVLRPICLVLALVMSHDRSTQGHLDQKKVAETQAMLLGGMLLNAWGLAEIGTMVIGRVRGFSTSNPVESVFATWLALFLLFVLIHFLLVTPLSKRWRRG